MRRVLLLLAAAAALAQDSPPVDWIRNKAIPLDTAVAGNGFADLQPLKTIIGDARVVSLGEATHGTREFFQMKHRMLEFLASEMGFTLFAIEDNLPEAYRLNEYVLTGAGDPQELVKGLTHWPWKTEEVLELVRWMREFNASGRGPVQFTGFDMQSPALPARIVHDFLASADPAYVDAADAAYAEAVPHAAYDRAAYALLSGMVPAGARKLRFGAMVRTEKVTRGVPGLFWTTTNGRQRTGYGLFIGYTQLPPNEWTRIEGEIDLPAGSTTFQFGPYYAGDGVVWFDGLSIQTDGPNVPGNFDLSFELPRLAYTVWNQGYAVEPDPTVAWSGRQSLRVLYLGRSAAESVAGAEAVVAHLEEARERYRAAGRSEDEVEWATRNARIVVDAVRCAMDGSTRDPAMARNVEWILDRNPGAKIVLWAHNGHVAGGGFLSYPYEPMGAALRRHYGAEMVILGFALNQGSFQAIGTNGLQEFTVPPAGEGTLRRWPRPAFRFSRCRYATRPPGSRRSGRVSAWAPSITRATIIASRSSPPRPSTSCCFSMAPHGRVRCRRPVKPVAPWPSPACD